MFGTPLVKLRKGPTTVPESMVSNTELSEFFALTEFQKESSVSSSQPITCVSENQESPPCKGSVMEVVWLSLGSSVDIFE